MRSTRFIRFFRHLTLPTLKQVVEQTGKQRLTGLASEMAYNSMLALFPAILAIFTAIGLFAPLRTTVHSLATQLSQVAPNEVQILIRGFVGEVSQSQNQSLFSLSFIGAVWAFSGAISAAMTALDQIQQTPAAQMRPFWRAKLVALVLTLGTIALLLMASTLLFISNWIVQEVAQQSGVFQLILLQIWASLLGPLALVIISVAFAFIYRYGPSRWRAGTPVMPGAILAAIAWALLSNLFRLYVSHFGNYNRAYGAVGAAIILLLWLYMSSLVVLLGNQLNVTVGAAMSTAKPQSSPRHSSSSKP